MQIIQKKVNMKIFVMNIFEKIILNVWIFLNVTIKYMFSTSENETLILYFKKIILKI